MDLTWFDSNSWLIEMAGARVLLDPWLVGDLIFGNAPWFFKATHRQPIAIPDNLSFILLSQGLPDHAHVETLSQLDRSIPVVGSPNAAKVAKSLGFQTVAALAHTETFIWNQTLEVRAFPGSLVGPQLVENAYVLTDLHDRTKLYYEPHGNHSPTLKAAAPVDVVIAPLIDLKLPLVGAFIRGGDRALDLIQWLQPQAVLPTTIDGEIESEGFLNKLISAEGTLEGFCDRLHQVLPAARVLIPKPGQRLSIPLQTVPQNLQIAS
ncbi:MBL fold metallo-hydrolase [Altericista sp. CCNU0014]|uniref:MBL fold metallo-hydrolase n=1 Tax=Altericista sp. CCNU0014 TaxID=3082949 RepID=UPI00384A7B2E